ncbi:MAG: DNA-methyltransferase [Fidelibacterota bacterium]
MKISENFDKKADLVYYNGNCLDLLAQLPDNYFTLIVTSPPYNIGKEYEKRVRLKTYLDFQKKVIEKSVRTLKQNGSICWQIGNYIENGEIKPLDILLYPIFSELGLKLRNRIVWHFGHGLHASKRFSGRYEVILWFTKSDNYTFNLDPVRVPQKYPNKKHFKGPKRGELSGNPLGKNPSDVWEIPNVKSNHIEKTIHPAQFPVELIERLVLSLTNKGDCTFDPFAGVGTTQIASIIHQRKSVGSELEKKYYAVALERFNAVKNSTLKILPMERPVYDPQKNNHIPPKIIQYKKPVQLNLSIKQEKKNYENRI